MSSDSAPLDAAALEVLHRQDTWKLVVLSVLTFYIYLAFAVRRWTDEFNAHLEDKHKIPPLLGDFILGLEVFTLLMFLAAHILGDTEGALMAIRNLFELVAAVLLIVWAFQVRTRLGALEPFRQAPGRMHGLWTFLFHGFYLNHKLNRLGAPTSATA